MTDEATVGEDLAAVFHVRQIDGEGARVRGKSHAQAILGDAAVPAIALLGPGLAGDEQGP